MSAVWDDRVLLEPISAEQPCGQNLDEVPVLPGGQTAVLYDLDGMRLFGQARSPEAPPETPAEDGEREQEKVRAPIEWDRVRGLALEGLGHSKDLRLLVYLGTALLRTDGLPAFARTIVIGAQWLEAYWPQVYPLLDDGDVIARRNALNCFADPMAVVDRVWRTPLVASRQHGRFSLRDIDVATGAVSPATNEGRPDQRAIQEAFKEIPTEELTAREQGVAAALAALAAMDAQIRSVAGAEDAPDFTPLTTQFAKLHRIYKEQLASRGEAAPAGETGAAASGETGGPAVASGPIRSRQDAIRALEGVAEFFRRNEPSSPIPLFVERAKRLVSKDFLEVLADIAPDAVLTARSAGGLKPEE